jgi:hypothetical protein
MRRSAIPTSANPRWSMPRSTIPQTSAAVLRLPRPEPSAAVFSAPWHPVRVMLFLGLISSVLVLFAVGQPAQTLLGAAIAAAGVPVSFLVVRRQPGRVA